MYQWPTFENYQNNKNDEFGIVARLYERLEMLKEYLATGAFKKELKAMGVIK